MKVVMQQCAESDLVYSIVSHGQLHLIQHLLSDLRSVLLPSQSIILVLNIPEDESILENFSDLNMLVIRNERPKGFGENHNHAFLQSRSKRFAVINPDIRIPANFNMALLLQSLQNADVAAVVPKVVAPDGKVEDNVRRFPTVPRLLARVLLGRRASDYTLERLPVTVDWAAGMFVVFDSNAFRYVGGFDDRFFMYMEDADVCRRLKLSGWNTSIEPSVTVVHDAQRASRRSAKHLRWHIASALRFLLLKPRNAGKSASAFILEESL